MDQQYEVRIRFRAPTADAMEAFSRWLSSMLATGYAGVATDIEYVSPAGEVYRLDHHAWTPLGNEPGRDALVSGGQLAELLISSGIISAEDKARRVVIDVRAGEVPRVLVERIGDSRLLDVELWAGLKRDLAEPADG